MKKREVQVDLGGILRRALKRKGWNQQKLAEYMDTNQASVSEWVNNKKIRKWLEFIDLVNKLEIVEDVFPEHSKHKQENLNEIHNTVKALADKVDRVESLLKKKSEVATTATKKRSRRKRKQEVV